ncbi:MAG: polyprenyl synthetase family protein [Polyangiaceae bacterium]
MPAKTRTSKKKRRKTPPPGPPRPKAKAIGKNAFVALSSAFRRDIDVRLQRFLDDKLEQTKPHGQEVVELVRSMRELCLRGGKRTRPALLITGYRAATPSAAIEPALDAGVALELLHAYFLIHDDWMDDDSVRRGGPAVHTWLSERLHSRRLGDRAGILAGDLACSYAQEALSRVQISPSRMLRALACFAEMQNAAIYGQELDIVARAPNPEKVYELKTASYTVSGPLRLGALLGGGGQGLLDTLDRFALPAGVAFQLRDDLLGVFGDPEQTGKPYGSDLKSGKRTPLLLAGLKRARGKDHRLLKSVVGNGKAKRTDLARAIEVLERSGAREQVEGRIAELVREAMAALQSSKLSKDARLLLEGAARAMTTRVS